MPARKVAYQYETSPKKIEPEYHSKKKSKKYVPKTPKSKVNNVKKKALLKMKEETKQKVKICTYIFVLFAMFLLISYRNTLINQNFAQIQKIKSNVQEVEKENEQIDMNIRNSLNLPNIEEQAKLLGMQKLSNSQKIYITLDKKDYVEASGEAVVIEEKSWFDNLIDAILSIF